MRKNDRLTVKLHGGREKFRASKCSETIGLESWLNKLNPVSIFAVFIIELFFFMAFKGHFTIRRRRFIDHFEARRKQRATVAYQTNRPFVLELLKVRLDVFVVTLRRNLARQRIERSQFIAFPAV